MDLLDLKLENMLEYDPDLKSLKGNPQMLYYRQPTAREYPLDLNKGYAEYIPRGDNFLRAFGVVQHHVMHLREPRQLLDQTHFCLNRGTMLKFMGDRTHSEFNFAACRFKGCIYVRSLREDERNFKPKKTRTHPYKARQYVFTSSPGEPPNSDAPVDERKQFYGVFSAKLGDFRLLYSAEVSGVWNKEPLGDLNDPEVLKRCRLATVRLEHTNQSEPRPLWLMQSYLGGIGQIAIAKPNKSGLVCRPIEVVSCAEKLGKCKFNIQNGLKQMHGILAQIGSRLANEDNPEMEIKFKILGASILFEDHLQSVNPPGNFDQKFIDFTNQLYVPK
ncbi:decapping nuclease DXO homolog [Drosophila subobscura]|uniref:decapping nuclease DXO homolog n=1 Tax=Drosophila subobscura TaxID=7241 RepID=UPI00155B2E05|nr:decapping nuclease DXO homolog [Drosophila subobscura]